VAIIVHILRKSQQHARLNFVPIKAFEHNCDLAMFLQDTTYLDLNWHWLQVPAVWHFLFMIPNVVDWLCANANAMCTCGQSRVLNTREKSKVVVFWGLFPLRLLEPTATSAYKPFCCQFHYTANWQKSGNWFRLCVVRRKQYIFPVSNTNLWTENIPIGTLAQLYRY
jgi:hypothetical protein